MLQIFVTWLKTSDSAGALFCKLRCLVTIFLSVPIPLHFSQPRSHNNNFFVFDVIVIDLIYSFIMQGP